MGSECAELVALRISEYSPRLLASADIIVDASPQQPCATHHGRPAMSVLWAPSNAASVPREVV